MLAVGILFIWGFLWLMGQVTGGAFQESSEPPSAPGAGGPEISKVTTPPTKGRHNPFRIGH